MLDQQIAPPLALAEQRAHLVERARIDLSALGRTAGTAADTIAATGTRWNLDVHGFSSLRIEPFQARQTIPCRPCDQ